jgi:hypothetical protein
MARKDGGGVSGKLLFMLKKGVESIMSVRPYHITTCSSASHGAACTPTRP